MSGSESLVRLAGVDVSYGRRPVLEGVDLTVPKGSFFGVIGPNGSGKTTLLRCLLGLLAPERGSIEWPAGRPAFGYVHQRQVLDDLFPVTAEDLVLMGRAALAGPCRGYRSVDREAAREAMATVGIEDLADRLFRNLSGGQKQRCLLARALASEPELLVLDEPTNDMDIAGEESTLRLLDRIRRQRGLTVVMVSHLLNLVIHFAEHLALVREGRVTTGSIEELGRDDTFSRFFGLPIHVDRVAGRRVVVPVPEDGPRSRGEG